MTHKLLGAFALAIGTALPVLAQSPKVDNVEGDGARYVTTTDRAVVRNFPDMNGAPLATLAPGNVARAYRKSTGATIFLECEVAGGFPVWVYGAYLQPTEDETVLLVTGSHVNMRPLPELTSASMPLRSKLEIGQRVRFLERANKNTKFEEDWIRIQAPSNAKAWIAETSLKAIDVREGKKEWALAVDDLPVAAPLEMSKLTAKGTKEAAAQKADPDAGEAPIVTADVLEALAAANKAWDAAESLRVPTSAAWTDVAEQYRAILDAAPEGSAVADTAARRLKQADMRVHIETLREDLEASRQRTAEEIRQIDVFLDSRKKRSSARWGKYEERGWVEARRIDGQTRWYMTFGGETVSELRCQSGRYDLNVFEGFEIGVVGREVAPVVRATSTSLAEARIVDATRIEVISGSGRRR